MQYLYEELRAYYESEEKSFLQSNYPLRIPQQLEIKFLSDIGLQIFWNNRYKSKNWGSLDLYDHQLGSNIFLQTSLQELRQSRRR